MDGKNENANYNSGKARSISESQFIVRYNPKRDGNCQFSVVSHLLQTIYNIYTIQICALSMLGVGPD